LKQDLEVLCHYWLIARICWEQANAQQTVAGLSMLLKFRMDHIWICPRRSEVKGTGLADSVVYEPFSPGAIASTPNIANH